MSGAGNRNNKYLVMYDSKDIFAFEFPAGASAVMAEAAIEEFHALKDKAWDRAVARAYFPDECE